MTRKKILVVADKTADSPDLIAALGLRASRHPTAYTLLVPAVPHGLAWAADMTAGWSEAAVRADRAATRIREAGLPLEEVIVGDPDPLAAVGDVLHARSFDEIVVSVLPKSVSRWLALGLPARLRRTVDLPVIQVTAQARSQPLPSGREEAAAA